MYVGETGRRLADRFTEHRRDVISNKTEKEVASHFNSPGHNGTEDMSVLGLQSAHDLIKRKLLESKLIAKLGCVLGRGMNTDFNFAILLND